MGLPAETAGPFIAADVAIEKLQHRFAFTARQLVDVAGEVGVDKDAAAPALGVAHDHRMRGLGRARPEHPGAVVGGGQPREKSLHLVRQRLIGRIGAGEHGVAAAVGRYGVVVEHAAQRRHGRAGLVAVPALAGDALRGLVVVKAAHQRMVGGLADGLRAHVLAQRAEQAGKANLVVEADFLVAKEQHLVAHKGIFDLSLLLLGQRLRQIDVADFCADVRRSRCDADALVSRRSLGGGACGYRRADGGGEHGWVLLVAWTFRSGHGRCRDRRAPYCFGS